MRDQTNARNNIPQRSLPSAPWCPSTPLSPHGDFSHNAPKRRSATSTTPSRCCSEATKHHYYVGPASITSENDLSVADVVQELGSAAFELVRESCRAVSLMCKIAFSLGRVGFQVATVVLTTACLGVVFGVWAFAAGKRMWSRVFG